MVPNHLDGGDEELFVRRMDTTESGAEADHIKARILLAEETTLKTSMYATHNGFLAKQTLVFSHSDFQEE